MATSKKLPKVEDLHAYFFMSIQGTHVDLVYHDNTDKGLALGAGLASVLQEDEKLFDVFSSALLTAIEHRNKKEKYISKKSNKVPKTVKKSANKK